MQPHFRKVYSPPQSPDFNPIEQISDELDRRIRQHTTTSKEISKVAIQSALSDLTSDTKKNLALSMAKKNASSYRFHGNSTKY